jgi:hypothetical protein
VKSLSSASLKISGMFAPAGQPSRRVTLGEGGIPAGRGRPAARDRGPVARDDR